MDDVGNLGRVRNRPTAEATKLKSHLLGDICSMRQFRRKRSSSALAAFWLASGCLFLDDGGAHAEGVQKDNGRSEYVQNIFSLIDAEIRSKQAVRREVRNCIVNLNFITEMRAIPKEKDVEFRAVIHNVSDIPISGLDIVALDPVLIERGLARMGRIRFDPIPPGGVNEWVGRYKDRYGIFSTETNFEVRASHFLDVRGYDILDRYTSRWFSEREEDRNTLEKLLDGRCKPWNRHKELDWYGGE